MGGLTASFDRRKRHEFDIGDTLPLGAVHGPKVGGGVVLLVMGTLWTGLIAYLAMMMVQDPASVESDFGPLGSAVFLGVFMLIGFALTAGGVALLKHRFEVTISDERIRGSRRGLLGTHRFDEPMTAYRGVLQTERKVSRGKNRGQYTVYQVELVHRRDDALNVLLLATIRGKRQREEAERFARLLDLPVLIATGDDTFAERAVADLDKSVADLAREGKIETGVNLLAAAPGQRVQVRADGDAWVFELSTGSIRSALFGVVFAAVGAGLLYLYFGPGLASGGDRNSWVIAVVGGMFFAVGVALAIALRFWSTTLRISPHRVESVDFIADHPVNRDAMAAHLVEEVELSGDGNLVLAGDDGKLEVGVKTLSPAERDFLRERVMAILAGAAPAADTVAAGDADADRAAGPTRPPPASTARPGTRAQPARRGRSGFGLGFGFVGIVLIAALFFSVFMGRDGFDRLRGLLGTADPGAVSGWDRTPLPGEPGVRSAGIASAALGRVRDCLAAGVPAPRAATAVDSGGTARFVEIGATGLRGAVDGRDLTVAADRICLTRAGVEQAVPIVAVAVRITTARPDGSTGTTVRGEIDGGDARMVLDDDNPVAALASVRFRVPGGAGTCGDGACTLSLIAESAPFAGSRNADATGPAPFAVAR